MLTHLMAAAGVLGLLTVVPGPDMAVVTRRALAAGPADGLRTVGGIATGLLLWGALAAAGHTAVLAASPALYRTVGLLGAGCLVFLGGQALGQHRATAPAVPTTPHAPATPGGRAWSATSSTRRSPCATPACCPHSPHRACPPPGA
ncbi:LysE family translocator [Streptomyces sp. MAI_2237]